MDPIQFKNKKVVESKFIDFILRRGLSAIKIAEILNVNRNTINADIRDWYRKVSEEISEYNAFLLLKQIYRLEMQQARLLEELESSKEIKENFSIEKLLYAINAKMTTETSKLVFNRRDVLAGLRNRN